jgi:hypothetical protein
MRVLRRPVSTDHHPHTIRTSIRKINPTSPFRLKNLHPTNR